MTDHDALLATIIDRPDDDLPRLVYADWLEESGDADRAEFIRVQCELARLPADDPARPALEDREAELLAAHKPEWVIPGLRGLQDFRRGFVEAIVTTAEWLVAAAARVFGTAPVRDLRLVNADRYVRDLARLPGLARVQSLDLSNNTIAAGGRLARFLAEAPLDSLTGLTLRNNQLWPDAIQTLAASPVAPRLTRLDLSGNPLTDAGLITVADHPAFAGLTELVARGDEQHEENCVHASAASAVAGSRTLTRLRTLDLGSQYVGDAGLTDLVGSPNAAGLGVLDLSYNDIGFGETAARAVVESPHLGRLRVLNLSGNVLGRRAARMLARWPRLADVTVDLRECDMQDHARSCLLESEWADRFLLPDRPTTVTG